jgi:hypothetical protein
MGHRRFLLQEMIMTHLRFTLAGLVGLVTCAACTFAALRSASPLWDAAVFSMTIALLLAGTLLAVRCPGRCRAFWIGFVTVGAGYLILASLPATESRLLTSRPLRLLAERRPTGIAVVDLDSDGSLDLYVANSAGVPLYRAAGNGTFVDVTATAGVPIGLAASSGSSDDFVRIGHSFVALLLGYIAGRWSAARSAREQRGDVNRERVGTSVA